MGISECGTRLFSHVRCKATLEQFSDQRLVVDLASFKLKAWYSDVAGYYRPTEPQTHNYRASLARLLSALSLATGSTKNVTVCLDGGLFPPKSREHARRGSSGTDRGEIGIRSIGVHRVPMGSQAPTSVQPPQQLEWHGADRHELRDELTQKWTLPRLTLPRLTQKWTLPRRRLARVPRQALPGLLILLNARRHHLIPTSLQHAAHQCVAAPPPHVGEMYVAQSRALHKQRRQCVGAPPHVVEQRVTKIINVELGMVLDNFVMSYE